MSCHRTDDDCTNDECWVCEPTFCRFLDTETCRMGLNIAEHKHTAQGFQHPDGLDAKGYYAFGDKAVNR